MSLKKGNNMARSLNKVMIIGNLTRDPEARTTPNGVNVTSFGVATNFTWRDPQGNPQEKVEYHNVVAWRKLGEICAQYLKKGRKVYVEGRLQTRDWQDQAGMKHYRTEIIATDMVMLGAPMRESTPIQEVAPEPIKDTQGVSPTPETSTPQASPPIPPTSETPKTLPKEDQGEEEIKIEEIPF